MSVFRVDEPRAAPKGTVLLAVFYRSAHERSHDTLPPSLTVRSLPSDLSGCGLSTLDSALPMCGLFAVDFAVDAL